MKINKGNLAIFYQQSTFSETSNKKTQSTAYLGENSEDLDDLVSDY